MVTRKLVTLLCFYFVAAASGENLIPHSGFDTGVYGLWQSNYQDGRLVDDSDLDFAIFHDGVCSLKLTTWEGNYPWSGYQVRTESTFQINTGESEETYTLSAWVKSDREITFLSTVGGLQLQALVKPEEGWKRVTASGKLSGSHRLVLTATGTNYDARQLHAGCLWVDSLQLEKGSSASQWQAGEVEVGLVCREVANIFYAGRPVEILLLAGQSPEPFTLRYTSRLRDCFGQLLSEEKEQFLRVAAGKHGQKRLSFSSIRKGVFRLEVEGEMAFSGSSGRSFRREIPFYVVTPPDPGFWNPYGLYLQMTVPAMERASRLGLYWNNLLSAGGAITEWNKVYYRDSFLCEKFLPRLKVGQEKYHLRYIGNIANSSFPAPAYAWAEKEIPGQTLTLPPEGNSGPRYLKLSAYREYLETMGRFYSPYIGVWQIIDETNFRGKTYLALVREAAEILKKYNPQVKILATYPQNMAYVLLRGGEKCVDGLYDLGRERRRAAYAAKAAAIAGPEFPIFFYDCSLRFNYFSSSFNGWGKTAYASKEPLTDSDAEKALQEFLERLNDTLTRNIHPLSAGAHTLAICLYHARLPGGSSQSAFDVRGHPAPSLIAFSALNHLLGRGKSLGNITSKNLEGYLCGTAGNNWLAIVRPLPESDLKVLEVPERMSLRQLDLFGNDVTREKDGKVFIVFHPLFFTYLQARGVSEGQLREFLER